MSRSRRTFCLLTTFDLFLTFILWVIYTQVCGFIFMTPVVVMGHIASHVHAYNVMWAYRCGYSKSGVSSSNR